MKRNPNHKCSISSPGKICEIEERLYSYFWSPRLGVFREFDFREMGSSDPLSISV